MECRTPFAKDLRSEAKLVAEKALTGQAIRQGKEKGYQNIAFLQLLFSEFCFGLDRENATVVLLPYEGGVMDQPLFEYQLWQVFLEAYTLFKIEKDKEEARKNSAGARGMKRTR